MTLSETIKALTDAGVEECDEYDVLDSYETRSAIYLAHLKAWLRGRENVDEISVKEWRTSGGPWLVGVDLDYNTGEDQCKFVSGEAPTELEALASCVLAMLEGEG